MIEKWRVLYSVRNSGCVMCLPPISCIRHWQSKVIQVCYTNTISDVIEFIIDFQQFVLAHTRIIESWQFRLKYEEKERR